MVALIQDGAVSVIAVRARTTPSLMQRSMVSSQRLMETEMDKAEAVFFISMLFGAITLWAFLSCFLMYIIFEHEEFRILLVILVPVLLIGICSAPVFYRDFWWAVREWRS